MHTFRRLVAGVAGFSIVAAGALPASARIGSAAPQFSRVTVAGIPRSFEPVRDFGRRAPLAPITASLALRYNHEADLNALVEQQADRKSPLFRHFLTSAQFNAYFAPTPRQYAYLIAASQAAGFRVTQTFANRTVLDVAGPSQAAERFFGTEIHSVVQGRYGARFQNVKPATLSADLAPLVRSVSLSNLITAKTRPLTSSRGLSSFPTRLATAGSGRNARTASSPGRFRVASPRSETDASGRLNPNATVSTTNVVKDAGFESGAFKSGWKQCESLTISSAPQINKIDPATGAYDGFAGSTTTSEPTGYSGVCQLVTVPTSGILTASLSQTSTESAATYAAQDVFLINTQGFVAGVASQTVNNHAAYVSQSYDLSNFAGQQVYVYFGVHGDGASSLTTKQYVDNVSLATGTPSSSIPVVQPNINPANCTGKAENGPLDDNVAVPNGTADYGHLATGVAKAFDFPVQHGCDGTGETGAVVISNTVLQSDIDLYMKAAGIVQTGKLVNVLVDGGGPTADSGEADLDTETIVGLAPAATVNVYSIPSLTTQYIRDAYNRAVSDNTAVAVNSSFGGCEADGASDDQANDAIFVQGAALGITFVGTTGDTGSDECNDGPNGALSKGVSGGNSPHAVAIGSIDFTQNSSGALTGIQSASQSGSPDNGFASGGGVSQVYSLPRYQTGIANVITSGRNQPDLSLPGVSVPVYSNGQISEADGTSWSGPIFTALLTTGAQIHGTRGFGFANPMIYNMFKASKYSADFIDSTSGSNGAYTAAAGYDQVTGIGVPKGFTFTEAL